MLRPSDTSFNSNEKDNSSIRAMINVQEDCFSLSELDLPEFLKSTYISSDRCTVHINRLYVGLLSISGGLVNYVHVYDTPHYTFVRQILEGDVKGSISGYRDYDNYRSIHSHACSNEAFRKLIISIEKNGYDYENRPILVFRSWRRPWPLNRWNVADGFHRLAVLAAMGERYIHVATLKQKKNIFHRFTDRMMRRPT